MAASPSSGRPAFHRSIVCKNIALFLLILTVAVAPLAVRYYQDSRDYEIQVLASKLEFFAQRGASWLNVDEIATLTRPEHKDSQAYRNLLRDLNRIKSEFGVDNAIVMRRRPDGGYSYVAAEHGGFGIGQPVHIHEWFPATYRATDDTWKRGEMMHSQLFGGRVGDREFDQFLQINIPLKRGGGVESILMLNKFANPVAAAVRMKTIRLFGLTVAVLAVGLALFGVLSQRMLRPLQGLTEAAGKVSQGDLGVAVPPPRGDDEVGRLSIAFSGMVEGLRQRDFIRDTFGRYISQEVVDELLSSPDRLRLGGELREVTFLVSDLRGFTALSSRKEPQEVVRIINRYLEPMVDIITRFRGTVDEFQGDGILAFFGAPVAAADDPERAVACAIEMQVALERINALHRRENIPELQMGIGINTGEVIVGNIGSEKRTKYGAMGGAVNMAYRIESNTVSGQVLISSGTYARVRDAVRVRSERELQFKGIERPVAVYEVDGIGGKYACALPERAPEEFVALDPPLVVTCFALEGKRVSEEAIPGSITRLSEGSAEAALEGPVAAGANLMVRLAPREAPGLSDAYAKVVGVRPADGGSGPASVSLSFTSLPEDAQAFLEKRRAAAQG